MGSPLGSHNNPESTARAVRNLFAAVAPRYDFLNHFLSLRRDLRWRRLTAQSLRDVLACPNSIALDVCCGTGDLAFELQRVSSGKVVGTDFCYPMLQRAQLKFAAKGVSFLESDALVLPFADDRFDAVTVAFGVRNLASHQAGIEEMRRVLKPGGTLAILEFSRVRWPVFGPVFRFYFRHLLPRLGSWISGVGGAYEYLRDSVAQFPDQNAFAALLRDNGFQKVRYRNFSGGVSALHLAEKP